jgi:phosphatidylglycerol:prolipoprotein diacylglycerol transferase
MKRKRADPWNTMDLLAPYIALAQGLGRIGCFLNGCCYGTGGMPVQIYSSLLLFVIFMILMLWQKVRRFTGEIFLAYCVLYSFKRFGMEFLRGDNPGVLFGLTLSQAISLAVISIALPAFIVKSYRWSAKGTASK